MRTPRSVLCPALALGKGSGQPFVGYLWTDPEPPAQFPPVYVRLLEQSDELLSLIHE